MKVYNHKKIELECQKYWKKKGIYRTEDPLTSLGQASSGHEKPKYYVLDMFPYPSGDGLHMGHTESYTASDIIYRYKKLQGYDVLHRQGFDAFGLPAENYAIKTGIHPKKTTEKNIKNYLKQMKMLGLGYDYDHIVKTSDPSYYKWTQWLFGKFFENGLVERKTDRINWCPSCQTGIANEQVVDGRCERCKTKIQQKEVKGWFFKITKFAEDLIKDLDKVDWPKATKKNQRNWIGKSEGAKIKFEIKNSSQDSATSLEVFTTRPDTLFGVTYLVLAPEHEILKQVQDDNILGIRNIDEVKAYLEQTKNKTEMERLESKIKTGVKLEELIAVNPANDEEIPIFVADYVLGDYGTGAIMAVPAHDERDYEFAKKFDLPIKEVVIGKPEIQNLNIHSKIKNQNSKLFTGSGVLINSGQFDGMDSEEAKKKIIEFVGGEITTNYRLRDWSISRQRYWGCPIPIVYSPDGKAKFVGEENLPWLLPEDVDFRPTGTAPLAKSKELKERTEKIFGKGWAPEVDTMDTFVDSSWYFLRYPDPKNEKEFCSKEKLKKWLPVNLYIGGAEHTYMHLLYARFFVKAMHQMGLVDFSVKGGPTSDWNEPFLKLRHQGMVLDKNGVKMSKSKGNVINPDDMVKKFGADATRMYVMFASPLDEDVIWNEQGVKGVYRFLEKTWKLISNLKSQELQNNAKNTHNNAKNKKLMSFLHKTIKGVTEDIEELKFNTAISKLMIFINTASRLQKDAKRTRNNAENVQNFAETNTRKIMEKFLILLSPFAPFLSEKLWQQLGYQDSIFDQQWPKYDPDLIKDELVTMVIQINGKVRDNVQVSADITEKEARKLALSREKIKKWTTDQKIKKVIFVKGRLINLVVEYFVKMS